jgi:hypothetical protein
MCRCLHAFRAPVPLCTQKLSPATTPLFCTSLHLVFHSALLPVDLQVPVFYKVLPCQMWGQIPFRLCCTVGIPNQIPHHHNPVTKTMPHQNRSISILIQVIMKSTDTLKTSLIIMCLWIIRLPGTLNPRNDGRFITSPWFFQILSSVYCCF